MTQRARIGLDQPELIFVCGRTEAFVVSPNYPIHLSATRIQAEKLAVVTVRQPQLPVKLSQP